MTCIICPNSCQMTVEASGDTYNVTGHKCARGKAFAISEITNPTRTLCTTVKVNASYLPVISVKTSGPIPKNRLMDVMHVLHAITVNAPLTCGEVVVHDILGLGVDIVTTTSLSDISS
ncbi:DUF1667 domain-containing protein [Fusibacter paucivorans]|uniref:DUF1667 domain-containing protein n=1 Tax=Fusibacter paucivorans TaxID=76009 RepID=A0ABS5PNK6_9FIRM|nr:DUF1667 domain-containing protein [Fusibacter paucivorans]MBS7526156.1 DUF1667 domain-containing protein [Fusibacter paucivorans]